MNIGITTSVIGRGRTGIGQYIFGILRGLTACANEHKLYLFVLEEDLPMFEFVESAMKLVVVPEKFRAPAKDIFWHQTKLPRLARELNLDLIHTPSYRRLIWAEPCPRVATIHDLAACAVKNKYDLKRTLYGRYLARTLARRQNAIIAISNTTAWDINNYFQIPIERLDVIYNGIDHSRFCPGHPARQPERPFFLYVSRLEHPGKNHVRLIEAFSRFKFETGSSWELFLAGANWRGAEVIHKSIQCSPFSKNIHHLGFVNDEDLPDLYRMAGAFIYPSLYEGFGLPPVEAMACGCPVIASTRGGLAEVVDRAARLIDPTDLDSIVTAMTEVAGSLRCRDSLRSAGLTRAAQFDWNKAALATLEVYRRAAKVAAGATV